MKRHTLWVCLFIVRCFQFYPTPHKAPLFRAEMEGCIKSILPQKAPCFSTGAGFTSLLLLSLVQPLEQQL